MVIESPVCTPIGSRFSIEQTMMQLSRWSRTTSISNSFQPITDSSSSTSPVGEASSPRATIVSSSSRLRSEEHTSELQSQSNLVCRLLLEKKKNTQHFIL